MAPRVARRNGKATAHLPERLLDAFTIFADYGVNNIYLELSENPAAQMDDLRLCLKILSGFRSCRHTSAPISVGMESRQQDLAVIHDENLFPDPNLTLLAGMNRLSVKSMAKLVDTIDQWMRKKESGSRVGKYAGVYNAAFEFPKIRAQLKKPVVELNNVKWLLTETRDEAVSLEKIFIAHLAMDAAAASPQTVAKMIKSVYGDDYARINQTVLSERLHLSSNLLAAAEKRDKKTSVRKEVLGNLHQRLDLVKDHVIDEVHVSGQAGSGDSAEPDAVDSQIFDMVDFGKKFFFGSFLYSDYNC